MTDKKIDKVKQYKIDYKIMADNQWESVVNRLEKKEKISKEEIIHAMEISILADKSILDFEYRQKKEGKIKVTNEEILTFLNLMKKVCLYIE